MQTIFVTGASGFIGVNLIPYLVGDNWQVIAGVRDEASFEKLKRSLSRDVVEKIRPAYVGDINPGTSWGKFCQGSMAVVHLAARVHRDDEKSSDSDAKYFQINEAATASLAAQAAAAGAKHFVYVSSVLAMCSQSEEALSESTPCRSESAYGRSKLAGEKALITAANGSSMKWTILRLPLVYGMGQKANMDCLTQWIRKGIPLPLKGIKNRRSFLFVGNLSDVVLKILRSPQASGKIYLLSDGIDFSTPELTRLIARCLQRPARLFYLPVAFLRYLGNLGNFFERLLRKSLPLNSRNMNRLLGSLYVDSRLIKINLSWVPPCTPEEGFKIATQANNGAHRRTGDKLKRVFDLSVSFLALAALFPFLILVGILIVLMSPGPMLHWSARVGRENQIFKMAKFRTMGLDAPDVATHLLEEPEKYVTTWGLFLRKFSLDELPQLLNVLKGDMSLVGPRPALHNQYDLMALRTEKGIHRLLPGITGFAQICGRDRVSIPQKVSLDEYYLNHKNFLLDLRIIFKTFWNVFSRKDVSH